MSVHRSIATILVCVTLGIGIGALVTWSASQLSPQLIKAMVPRLDVAGAPELQRAALALGIINGTLWGAGLGALILVAVTWYESR